MKSWYKKKLVIIPSVVVLLLLVVFGVVAQRAANQAAADKVAAAASQAAVTKAAADKVIADKAAADKVIADKAAAAKAAQDAIDQAAADKAAAKAKIVADKAAAKAAAEKAAGRPDGALSLGESQTVDGIEITVTSFGKVHPRDFPSSDSFTWFAAKMSFKNVTDGPKTVMPDLQVRMDDPYVAEIRASAQEIKEGEHVPWGTFRPGTTVTGYVVWASIEPSVPGFSVIYDNLAGEEAIWWPAAK